MPSFCTACHWFFNDDRPTCPRDNFPLTKFDPTPIIGSLVGGKYKIEEMLVPVGNMICATGRQESTGVSVSIKAYGKDSIDMDAFFQTVSTWKSLKHENVAELIDIGEDESGLVYMISKHYFGETLAKRIDDLGQVKPDLTLHILAQILSGLDYLSQNGIAHANIMPANILMVDDKKIANMAKVFNWLLPPNCFKQTNIEHPSPLYRSPESIDGAPPTVTSDVYSIGCTLYEMMTGLPPFSGKDENEILLRQKEELPLTIRGAVPELDIPTLVDEMVMKCLEKDPRGRYQAFMPIKDDLLDAAKNSRIYLPSAADSEYESQSYGQKSDNSALASEARIPEPEASPEAEAKTEAKKAEEEIEEPLPPETRQEMEGTIKGLRSHMYTLTGVAIVVLVSLALVMGYEGSSEDHGPLWKKLFWQYQMSTGDNALKKGDFASAESSFTQAQSLADQFQDNEDRKIKSLKGLLALYEAKKDEKEAHAYRQEIVDLDKKRMEMLFSSAETDAESVKDVDLSVPVAEMSESTAQEYSEKFINKAKSYLQKGQVKKAESFLLKALSIEEKAQTKHNQACLECANQLAEESKPGEHLAEITSLLERSVSLSKKGNQKTETRVRTLLNLGLFQARKSQFDKAEASVKQALKLASELGIKDDATVKSVLAAYVELLEKAEENEKAAKYKS